MVSLCMWLCTKLTNAQTFLHDPLAVEMDVSEPVKKKTSFDTITESDGELLISYLSVRVVWDLKHYCVNATYIPVEDVDVCDPVKKKPRLDIDRDSAMGLSEFTSGKSTTLSEASLLNFN